MGVWTTAPVQKYGTMLVVVALSYAGFKLDRWRTDGLRDFHNRSKLYGGKDLSPGQKLW